MFPVLGGISGWYKMTSNMTVAPRFISARPSPMEDCSFD